MSDEKRVKIFIASSAELKEERDTCSGIIEQLNKSHKHLILEPIKWEIDTVPGNQPGHATIQKAINPKLEESDIAVFMFYSRIGQYTREEFELTTERGKKLFAYFKKGFSPKKETLAAYSNLLDFKESLNDTILYGEYEDINELEKLLFPALSFYLTEKYLVAAPTESVSILIRLLAAKEEEINRLKALTNTLPATGNEKELAQLIKEKESLQIELQQSKAFQEQQAKEKAALEQQLSLQTEHDALKKKALEEVERGNYAEAENYLKESAKTSIEETAATFYELAKIKKLQLQYKKAFDYFELAVKIAPENSLYLHEAGVMANDLGLYGKAMEYYEKALLLDRKTYGEEYTNTAICYNNLGLAYDSKGEYDKAINYYNKALVIDRKYYGEEHTKIAIRYNNIGEAYRSKGEDDKAIEYYNKALIIDLKYYGEEHTNIAIYYNNLGLVYDSKREYDRAIKYYNNALTIDKKYYGEEHLEIATRYNNLGLAYDSKGEYNRAIKYYNHALAIGRKYYGEEHPDIAIRYNNLGGVYGNKGEYDRAIKYYSKALAIGRKYYGEEHPDIARSYNNLGAAYYSKGEYDKAIDYYNLSLAIYQKFFPSNHPHIQTTQQNLQLAQQAKDNH